MSDHKTSPATTDLTPRQGPGLGMTGHPALSEALRTARREMEFDFLAVATATHKTTEAEQ